MKNFGRNFIIAFLMVLAIYQTGELWFGGLSDHNFFSFFSERSADDTDSPYILNRLIINLGDNKIVCRANGIYESEYKKIFDRAVSAAVSRGSFKNNSGGLDWNSLLQNRCIIYEYNCVFKGSDISGIFNIRGDNYNRITPHDTIIISPSSDSSVMTVIFYNTESGEYTGMELRDSGIIGQCYEECSIFDQEEQSIYYISSVRNGFNIFKSNEFIPRWQTESYEYPLIEPRAMLTDSAAIENNANIFFGNPAGKTVSRQGGTYTFSDETAVVKYYDTGVLEYSNYRAEGSGTDSFSDNYSAAVRLISQDSFVKNQYFLDSYEYSDNTYVFRFNYNINDLSVIMSDELKEKTGMASFIEVTVTKGKIDRYKKYSYRYVTSQKDKATASIDFINAVDGLYAELYKNGVTKAVDDISLCYIAGNKSFGLSWIVDIEGVSHVVDTKAGD